MIFQSHWLDLAPETEGCSPVGAIPQAKHAEWSAAVMFQRCMLGRHKNYHPPTQGTGKWFHSSYKSHTIQVLLAMYSHKCLKADMSHEYRDFFWSSIENKKSTACPFDPHTHQEMHGACLVSYYLQPIVDLHITTHPIWQLCISILLILRVMGKPGNLEKELYHDIVHRSTVRCATSCWRLYHNNHYKYVTCCSWHW